MACSKIFSRCAIFGGGRNGGNSSNTHSIWKINQNRTFYHHHHNNSSRSNTSSTASNLLRKFKDSILLLEATKGPAAKVAIGLCQAGTTAALVFGTGYSLSLLTTGHHPTSKASSVESTHPLLIDLNHDHPVDNHNLVDENTIIRYLEERKNLTEKRIKITYFHMLTSLLCAGLTSILSFSVFKNKAFLVQVGNRPLVAVGLGVITPFLMCSIVRNLPRTPDRDGKLAFGIKEMGHLLYSGSLGLIAAPLYLLGGQSMARAIYITAGCMAGLHGVAKIGPKDAILKLEKPLIFAVNAVLVSFLMTLLLRPNHYAYMSLYRFMMHGGLLIYSASYVHGLHKMEQTARSHLYDPVNAAMSLSMNLLNVFARLAFMLPPYFQLCRDHHICLPAVATKHKSSSLPVQSKNKPGNSGGGGNDGGSGSGNEM